MSLIPAICMMPLQRLAKPVLLRVVWVRMMVRALLLLIAMTMQLLPTAHGKRLPKPCLEPPRQSQELPPWVNSGRDPVALVLFGSISSINHQARSIRGLEEGLGLEAFVPIG